MEFKHQSVLLKEVLQYLPAKEGSIFVDGTLGGGGHTLAIASRFKNSNLKFKAIGVDRDLEAIFAAKKNLAKFEKQIIFIHDNYSNIPKILKSQEIEKVDFILLDLGVSSYQLDNPDRGFTFQSDAPLDMRMNQKDDLVAVNIVNYYSEKDLADIFYQYGDERNSRKIAGNIIESRKKNKIQTTKELSRIVERSFPANYKGKYKIHPATRIFQALRIETNDELNILQEFIPKAAELLAKDGRFLVISFHSGEDRIVKHTFRELEKNNKEKYKVLTKKPIIAGDDEIKANPRSHSAKLRILKKRNNKTASDLSLVIKNQ
jgi:16S rRNA (cytosine1402-N4)-methyltransferase